MLPLATCVWRRSWCAKSLASKLFAHCVVEFQLDLMPPVYVLVNDKSKKPQEQQSQQPQQSHAADDQSLFELVYAQPVELIRPNMSAVLA